MKVFQLMSLNWTLHEYLLTTNFMAASPLQSVYEEGEDKIELE